MSDVFERLADRQALYKSIAEAVSTNGGGNLRAAADDELRQVNEAFGARSVELRVSGQKVGTLSLREGRGSARAELKRGLAAGELSVRDVYAMADAGDRVAARLKVFDMVKALPGFGSKRAAAVMDAAGVTPPRRVGGMGRRQREAVERIFSERLGAGQR